MGCCWDHCVLAKELIEFRSGKRTATALGSVGLRLLCFCDRPVECAAYISHTC